jgi:hypothetical protein
MIMSARIESSTAWRACWSETATPCSAALALIFSTWRAGSAHWPSSAWVRSSEGVGGQSRRAQDGPAASRLASTSVSPSDRKKARHASSTAFGSVA